MMKYRQIVSYSNYVSGSGFAYTDAVDINDIVEVNSIDDLDPHLWYDGYVEDYMGGDEITKYLRGQEADGANVLVKVTIYAADADPLFDHPIKVFEAWENTLLSRFKEEK